jgi:hypothetical protein
MAGSTTPARLLPEGRKEEVRSFTVHKGYGLIMGGIWRAFDKAVTGRISCTIGGHSDVGQGAVQWRGAG